MGDRDPSVSLVISADRDRASVWRHSSGGGNVRAGSSAYRLGDERATRIEVGQAAAALGLDGIGATGADRILSFCFGSHALLGKHGVSYEDDHAGFGRAECLDVPSDRLPARGQLG